MIAFNPFKTKPIKGARPVIFHGLPIWIFVGVEDPKWGSSENDPRDGKLFCYIREHDMDISNMSEQKYETMARDPFSAADYQNSNKE